MIMFMKTYKCDEKNMTLKEFLEEYIKDYFVSIEYKKNGEVYVFVGTPRKPEEKVSKDV
jgi:hypothetical protein